MAAWLLYPETHRRFESSSPLQIEANNALLHAQLKANSTEADQKQQGVRGLLDALEQAVKDLQPSTATETQLRTTLESLAAELGPRA